jgi:23S rRNA pseudouridine2605 synthase
MALERLQKILAQAGLASRRQSEQWIAEGLVTINGQIAKLGDKAQLGKDAIKVKGKLLRNAESPTYLAFYKPRGVISMLADPQGRPTLKEYLSHVNSRVFPIGRLDFNSEGLLLLTNDGEFAQKLQRLDTLVRVYSVKVKGLPSAEMLSRVARGVRLTQPQERSFRPHSIQIKETLPNKTIIEVVLIGAGAYNLKSLFDTRGFLVEKVVRTAIGHLTLKNLPVGTFRYLKASQVLALLDQPELALKRLEDEPSHPANRRPPVVVIRPNARSTARPHTPLRPKVQVRIHPLSQRKRSPVQPLKKIKPRK